ncbi:ATP phosphoribosyltransferase [Myroides odoratimimus]|uniref:ATP phosphoribosyltransferase n=1 Tax=Myroides odoratimimus CIP 101113 TaxID=883154 RepID=A0AAV3F0Q8_9FLAO|nr:ATP phosphoribosyltransferase [Myroides odoratimimus]EHO08055.1 ATP phosphoribosyltransferase [Myroides odoratimimus CIP 101113]MDM1096371.1 ATP phosphoribosyltransferase [Myroides odoratimimus]MDM1414390.1 ATP phosphoribosyltransferase [Myroides odoratimimus]MDM1446729.1 ATP phosphoribosyltransferase [Myroides odoratimimus]MEC4007947.1 ATP phosphoribosyltransferase [Myroides odoratimimus]
MSKLKIAIQKSGRLSEKSLELLKECGIKFPNGGGKLIAESKNFPIEVLFLRDDDVTKYVEQQVADIGIVGENVYLEANLPVKVLEYLGFGSCRLSLAVSKEVDYTGITYFEGKKIATSYPFILEKYLKQQGVNASIEFISGSVEIAPSIGLANGVCDIVSSGSTLMSNGLKEVDKVLDSQAVLISNQALGKEKQVLLDKLLFRIKSVLNAKERKYILLNAPNDKLEQIISILPGMKSPTVLPLADEGWSSLHSVIQEDQFWDIIDELKALGAEGILVAPIEKMIY